MEKRRQKGEVKAQSLKAIGDALTRTYQDVVEQNIPPTLVDLLESLARKEASPKSETGDAAATLPDMAPD